MNFEGSNDEGEACDCSLALQIFRAPVSWTTWTCSTYGCRGVQMYKWSLHCLFSTFFRTSLALQLCFFVFVFIFILNANEEISLHKKSNPPKVGAGLGEMVHK